MAYERQLKKWAKQLQTEVIAAKKNPVNPFQQLKFSKAVLYQFEGGESMFKRGTKELITMEEEIILNASQTQEIISILGDTTTFGGGKADCFAPQHGVIFYDAKKQPIGHVTICMSCNHLESSHSIGANLYHYIIEQIQKDDIYIIRSGFSKLGRMRLAKFFKKCGLKYEYQRSIFE